MYKVFVNDKPIILTTSFPKEEVFPVYHAKNITISELLHRLKVDVLQGVFLYSYNLEEDWELFLQNFKVVEAAGGLVENPKNELLFIFRAGKWDLPKGHIEKGEGKEEAAIREVEEECGISNLSLDKFLTTTYHIYIQNSELCLKVTYWYLMFSDYSGELIPQLEEGITKVVFKNDEQVKEAFTNTYGNIKLVYEVFKMYNSDTLS